MELWEVPLRLVGSRVLYIAHDSTLKMDFLVGGPFSADGAIGKQYVDHLKLCSARRYGSDTILGSPLRDRSVGLLNRPESRPSSLARR